MDLFHRAAQRHKPVRNTGGNRMRAVRMITAVEAHAEGEPGRVVTSGAPPLPTLSQVTKVNSTSAMMACLLTIVSVTLLTPQSE